MNGKAILQWVLVCLTRKVTLYIMYVGSNVSIEVCDLTAPSVLSSGHHTNVLFLIFVNQCEHAFKLHHCEHAFKLHKICNDLN